MEWPLRHKYILIKPCNWQFIQLFDTFLVMWSWTNNQDLTISKFLFIWLLTLFIALDHTEKGIFFLSESGQCIRLLQDVKCLWLNRIVATLAQPNDFRSIYSKHNAVKRACFYLWSLNLKSKGCNKVPSPTGRHWTPGSEGFCVWVGCNVTRSL